MGQAKTSVCHFGTKRSDKRKKKKEKKAGRYLRRYVRTVHLFVCPLLSSRIFCRCWLSEILSLLSYTISLGDYGVRFDACSGDAFSSAIGRAIKLGNCQPRSTTTKSPPFVCAWMKKIMAMVVIGFNSPAMPVFDLNCPLLRTWEVGVGWRAPTLFVHCILPFLLCSCRVRLGQVQCSNAGAAGIHQSACFLVPSPVLKW